MPPRHFDRTFPRVMGVLYALALLSLLPQIRGLFGAHGLRPLAAILPAARAGYGATIYFRFPSLFWIAQSDAFLLAVTWLGVGLAVTLAAGRARLACAIALWGIYLSWVLVGEPFLSFQWDSLLLETGFLTVVLCLAGRAERWTVWALRLLLFRLMFSSGVVKLSSGDPTWHALTALTVHYETQPLPTPLAWYLHQLPVWFHKLSVAAVFLVEIGLPWLLFVGRRARWVAAGGFALLQILILASGNYGIFNWLTLALVPWWLVESDPQPASTRRERAARAAAIALIALGALRTTDALIGLPSPLAFPARLAGQWEIVNPYGLFAVMTTERDEIEIEGSDDGATWKPYAFRYKPGDPARRPPLVAPHMPRLDWQMWFAALAPGQLPPWLATLAERLEAGEPSVLGLLGDNPFPQRPPRSVRLRLHRYRFTRSGEGSDWWKREEVHP